MASSPKAVIVEKTNWGVESDISNRVFPYSIIVEPSAYSVYRFVCNKIQHDERFRFLYYLGGFIGADIKGEDV